MHSYSYRGIRSEMPDFTPAQTGTASLSLSLSPPHAQTERYIEVIAEVTPPHGAHLCAPGAQVSAGRVGQAAGAHGIRGDA
ncbi:hypothetical protein GCM10022203_21390 [Micrococcus yunnanensis]